MVGAMSRNEIFQIARDRRDVSAFADRFESFCNESGVPEAVVRAFQVAFDELLTNTIDYALAGVDMPRMEVRVQVDDTAVNAEIVDNGIEFDPLAEVATPDLDLDIDEREIGGLGVHLVRNLMDEVRYQRIGEHNHFFISKRL